MAIKKALVLYNGEPAQLQSGDTLGGPVAEVELISLTNSDAASTAIGDIMYIFGSDSLKKAKADAAGTADAFAIATAVIANAATGNFQVNGIVSGLSGLTAGATYYLSATTAGAMTVTAPSATGQLVVRLGKALSATEFALNIQRAYLL